MGGRRKRKKKFKKTKNEEKIYCNLDRKNAGLEKLGQNKSIISIEKIVFCASHYCLCFCCRFFFVCRMYVLKRVCVCVRILIFTCIYPSTAAVFYIYPCFFICINSYVDINVSLSQFSIVFALDLRDY